MLMSTLVASFSVGGDAIQHPLVVSRMSAFVVVLLCFGVGSDYDYYSALYHTTIYYITKHL